MNKEQCANFSRENFNNPTRELEAKNIEIETLKAKILELEEKNTKLEKIAYINPVSGCLNNVYFNDFIRNSETPKDNNIALVFIDINDLKKTNDKEGHQAGNKLIKDTGDFLKTHFRTEDTVVHIGGDEFVVICRDERSHDINNFRDNLASSVEKRIVIESPISLACGVSLFDKTLDSTLIETLDRADKLMYKCKKEMKSKKTRTNLD